MTDEASGPWAFTASGGGWLLAGDEHGAKLKVRFEPGEEGRLEPKELCLASPRPIDSTMLRRLPLRYADVVANGEVLEDLRARLHEPGFDARDEPDVHAAISAIWRKRSARLKVPDGPKPDTFYRRVASIYSRLATTGNRPAVELAEANGVPLTTAHRWVREARRRGHLPPGRKGKAG